jgi:DNA-binding NtrC family response regulator
VEAGVVKYTEAVNEFRRQYWTQLLAKHNGHVKPAAKEAGINRTHCYKALNRLGVPYVSTRHEGNWGDL